MMRSFTTLVLLTACTGCSKTFSDRSLTFVSVPQAKAVIADEGGSWLKEARPNVWVDVRNPSKFTLGHIPGALNMPLRSVDTQWMRLEPYGAVVVYGNTWNDPLADALSKVLLEKGIKHVDTLSGGWDAWEEAGGEIARGKDPELVESEAVLDRRRRDR